MGWLNVVVAAARCAHPGRTPPPPQTGATHLQQAKKLNPGLSDRFAIFVREQVRAVSQCVRTSLRLMLDHGCAAAASAAGWWCGFGDDLFVMTVLGGCGGCRSTSSAPRPPPAGRTRQTWCHTWSSRCGAPDHCRHTLWPAALPR